MTDTNEGIWVMLLFCKTRLIDNNKTNIILIEINSKVIEPFASIELFFGSDNATD